jgi:hypothetical protein
MNQLSGILNNISTANDICVLAVVAEGCHNQEPIMISEVKNFLAAEEPTVQFFHICINEDEEMVFPRPATQILYFFIPGNTTPVFHRISFPISNTLKTDITNLRKIQQGETYQTIMFPDTPGIVEMIDDIITTENLENYSEEYKQSRKLAAEMWRSSKRLLIKTLPLVPADIANNRFNTCKGCSFFLKNRCLQCGCYINGKLHQTETECPSKLWGKYEYPSPSE